MKTVERALVCQRCGYQWVSRVDEPRACPRCKRYDWKQWKEAK